MSTHNDELTAKLEASLRQVGDLIQAIGTAALARIHDAEHAAVQRIEKYTPQDRLLTLKEAAAYLHFSPSTIDGYTAPGQAPLIQFTMIGRKKRFKKIWLDQALDSGSVKPRATPAL